VSELAVTITEAIQNSRMKKQEHTSIRMSTTIYMISEIFALSM